MTFDPATLTAFEFARRLDSIELEQPRANQRIPAFSRVVFAPAMFVGFLFSCIVFGACIAAIGLEEQRPFIRELGTAWLITLGLSMTAGGLAALAIAAWQLGNWNNNQVTRRVVNFTDKPKEPPQRARILTKDEAQPSRWAVSRYAWGANELAKLAKRLLGRNGEWIGPDRLSRNQLTGIITNLTQNYADVLLDLQEWGWIDANNYWTDTGEQELRSHLHFP